MPQGLQVFDAAGVIVVDLGSKLGRVHGAIQKIGSGAAGSQDIPSLAVGTPFWLLVQIPLTGDYSQVTITRTGTTLSWSAYVVGWTLYYGTY